MQCRYVVFFEQIAKSDSGNYPDFSSRLSGNFSDRVVPDPVDIRSGSGGNYFFLYPNGEMPEEDVENIKRIGGEIKGGPFTCDVQKSPHHCPVLKLY